MEKTALATQIPKCLKKELDSLCTEKGFSISHLTTEALSEKIESIREEEALLHLALERMAQPGELSYSDYKKFLKTLS